MEEQKVYFALRQKKATYIKLTGQDYQRLGELDLVPGTKLFLTGVSFTLKPEFAQFNLATYWQKKSNKKPLDQGWYNLTNLGSLDAALNAYKARSGIEAMFKDCKSGGYNERGVQSITRAVESDSFAARCCLHLCGIDRTKNQESGATEIRESAQRAGNN